MWAVDDRGSLVPTTGPGIPTTVVPGSEGPVLLTGRVDERGVVRRLESGSPVVVEVSDGVGMANVDGDLTVLSDLPVVRVRIVGSSGPVVDVEVAAGYPGLELSPGVEIAVVVRRGDGVLQVGTVRTGDHTGRWTESLWTTSADLELDRDALTLLDAERGPSLPLLVGLGRTLRSIGPVGYGAGRPLPVTVDGVGRWTLAPSAEGAALLVPGTALRARVASRLRRS